MRWNVALALLIAATPLALRAQETTVFDDADIWKLYSNFQLAITEIGDSHGTLAGVGVGTIKDEQWRFGLATHTLVDDLTTDNDELSLSTWDYWDLGADLGYIFAPAQLFHVDAGVFAGAGRIQRDRDNEQDDTFLVLQPSVAVCVNLHETWELGLSAGWRFTEGFGIGSLDDGDTSDYVVTLFARATQY